MVLGNSVRGLMKLDGSSSKESDGMGGRLIASSLMAFGLTYKGFSDATVPRTHIKMWFVRVISIAVRYAMVRQQSAREVTAIFDMGRRVVGVNRSGS